MKEPYKRKRTKIRLLVSFNGVFQRRQPSGKPRYTGGETRILSVDRTITLSSLKSQVLDLVVQSCNNGCTTFFLFLKYQLQDCCESERSDLFPINNDDDVACMIDQFEKLEFDGKLTRLWVFACNNSEGSCGGIISRKAHHVSTKNEKGNVKKLSDDYSLRKMVLKQQLLAKQYSKNGVDLCNNMLDYEYDKNGDFGGNNEGVLELIPLSKSRPLNSKDNNLRLGVNCEVTKGSLDESDCSGVGSELKSTESRIDAKLEAAASVDSTQLSIMNRENIVPWRMDFNVPRNGVALLSRNNQLVASACTLMQGTRVVFGGPCCSLHNHRVGLSESRNARNYLYQIRNRGSGYEMGKHHNFRLNGKSAIGKNYPGIRSGSSILKRGQTVRSYDFASLKDSYGHRCPTVKEVTEVNKLTPNNNSCGVEELVDKSGKGLPQHGEGDSTECRMDYGFRNIIKSDGSPLPISSGTMAINSQKDLLSCPDYGKLETQCQALSKDLVGRSTSCKPLSDISKDLRLLDQQEVNKIISSEDNLKWRCDSMTFSSYQNSANSSQHSISSAVDLSLHDLYLSRSSKLELESSPQSQDFEAMDEEHLSLGNPVEKSSGAVSCLLLDGDFRKKNYNNSEEDMQHSTQTNPSICEQVENGKENKCSNVNAVPDDILACYPYAAKTGLQTIKNNDLEYIKELGSGTYGTVFYGKWKGSDVAIKRLKPSCFTEGTVEEDRLVTDFWKEAHTLGQLHHPNIVALYGVVTDGPANNLATVTEYMVNGSLKQVLRRKDRTIDRRKRLIIAMDAAFGMEYLHEKNIVHFDLKSHNFLVNMRDPLRPVCKIGDLGLSKIKQRTLVSGGVRGTIPWMAPELLNGENMVTEKVDVYSFGIVMWELLTGEEPYSKMRAEEVIVGIIRGNLRPEVPRWCDPGWRSLMERCWSADPKARPGFSDMAKELRAMAAAMNIK